MVSECLILSFNLLIDFFRSSNQDGSILVSAFLKNKSSDFAVLIFTLSLY